MHMLISSQRVQTTLAFSTVYKFYARGDNTTSMD